MRVGIIGGGAAGLAAAYELGLRGHSCQVFESAPFLGGQASTFMVGETPLERGYHHLFRSDQSMIDLMKELGIEDQLSWIDSNVGYFSQNQLWPFTSPFDLLKFKPLSFLDRIRLGIVTLKLQRTKDWENFENITAVEWLKENLSSRIYTTIFEPMLRGKFGKYYDQITMAWLWNKFALRTASRGKGLLGRFKEQLGYPIGSFDIIFNNLKSKIVELDGEIHTSSRIERIRVNQGKATGLEVKFLQGNTESREYDAILATTPSYVFSQLVEPLPSEYLSKLNDKNYLSAVLVILVLDRPLMPHYWVYAGDRELPFLGIIEHTNLIPSENYGNQHIVYLTNYLEKEDRLYNLSSEELFLEYLPHLKRLNHNFSESWVLDYHYHRVDAAQPIVTKNYRESIPNHRTPIENLYLANTTQIYPEDRGTNYSVRMGREVGAMIDSDFQSNNKSRTN